MTHFGKRHGTKRNVMNDSWTGSCSCGIVFHNPSASSFFSLHFMDRQHFEHFFVLIFLLDGVRLAFGARHQPPPPLRSGRQIGNQTVKVSIFVVVDDEGEKDPSKTF